MRFRARAKRSILLIVSCLLISTGCETVRSTDHFVNSSVRRSIQPVATIDESEAPRLLQAAVDAHASRDYESSRRTLAILLKDDPNNVGALELLADVARDQQDWRLMRATLRRRARSDTNSASIQNRIGKQLIHSVRLERAAEAQTRTGIQQVGFQFDAGRSESTTNSDPTQVLNSGVALLKRAVELEPRNKAFVQDLVGAQVELGQETAAIGTIQKAIQLNPSDSSLAIMAARLQESRNEWGQAAYFYDLALRLEPRNQIWHRQRGMCLYNMGNFSEANKDFEFALPGTPVKPQLVEHVAWANCYLRMGRLNELSRLLDRIAIDNRIRNSEIEALRVACKAQQDAPKEAIQILRQAQQEWPNDSKLHAAEQMLREKMGTNELAAVSQSAVNYTGLTVGR